MEKDGQINKKESYKIGKSVRTIIQNLWSTIGKNVIIFSIRSVII